MHVDALRLLDDNGDPLDVTGELGLRRLALGELALRARAREFGVFRNALGTVDLDLDLEASESVSMHFGTFQLTTEGIDEPVRALEAACHDRNIPPSRFRTLDFGESLRLG